MKRALSILVIVQPLLLIFMLGGILQGVYDIDYEDNSIYDPDSLMVNILVGLTVFCAFLHIVKELANKLDDTYFQYAQRTLKQIETAKKLALLFAVYCLSVYLTVGFLTSHSLVDAEDKAIQYGFFIWLFTISLYFLFSKNEQEEDLRLLSINQNKVLISVIEKLQKRANELKLVCRLIALAIALCIATGISLFYLADTNARNFDPAFQTKKIMDQHNHLFSDGSRYGLNRKPEAITEEEFKKEVKIISDGIASLEKRFIDDANKNKSESHMVIVSSLSTRIGIIFLLVFLVQILVSMLRYNLKLAALYNSRADTLRLVKNVSDLDISYLKELFRTDNIQFTGPEANSAVEQAVDLAKAIMSKSGKDSSVETKKSADNSAG
ncbi:hypothetical protein [Pseudoalteromonas ardens]|nr:hypothetical protein [Pseudoalteromonas sp. R96]MDK1310327.1 hypothetical protein [Pseudoalteromonas sp. R96]